jgi:chromate transport protein ChrA
VSETSSVPALKELFLRFTQISLSGFGGVMPFARRMLVEERRWLSAEEFTDVLSLCQLLPGPNIVNVAVCVGARYHGVRGAVAAFAGLMTAPFFIMLALGALYLITLSADHSWPAFATTAVTAAFVLATRIHPLWLFGAAGLIGLAGWV